MSRPVGLNILTLFERTLELMWRVMDTDPENVQETLDEISAACDLWSEATVSDDGVRATLIGAGIADVVTENELRHLVVLTLRQLGGNVHQDFLVEQVTWWITTEAQAAVRSLGLLLTTLKPRWLGPMIPSRSPTKWRRGTPRRHRP